MPTVGFIEYFSLLKDAGNHECVQNIEGDPDLMRYLNLLCLVKRFSVQLVSLFFLSSSVVVDVQCIITLFSLSCLF